MRLTLKGYCFVSVVSMLALLCYLPSVYKTYTTILTMTHFTALELIGTGCVTVIATTLLVTFVIATRQLFINLNPRREKKK